MHPRFLRGAIVLTLSIVTTVAVARASTRDASTPPATARGERMNAAARDAEPALARPQQSSPPGSTSVPDVERGARLFVSYNCADCHGAGGSGAMAPSLADNRWHYGGSQGEVFRSIAEGRPGGMPTWGGTIPGPDMVALATYVSSLGEGKDLTTENFTGATVERSGR